MPRLIYPVAILATAAVLAFSGCGSGHPAKAPEKQAPIEQPSVLAPKDSVQNPPTQKTNGSDQPSVEPQSKPVEQKIETKPKPVTRPKDIR
ncbi:MAG: hypothetical protein RMI91_12790 [Gemmatales bacterium]|nr:hypothetical protein [Gemmatales bacterium]MDW7995519.1 hypothetical protein [Gemmatales bacterium]